MTIWILNFKGNVDLPLWLRVFLLSLAVLGNLALLIWIVRNW